MPKKKTAAQRKQKKNKDKRNKVKERVDKFQNIKFLKESFKNKVNMIRAAQTIYERYEGRCNNLEEDDCNSLNLSNHYCYYSDDTCHGDSLTKNEFIDSINIGFNHFVEGDGRKMIFSNDVNIVKEEFKYIFSINKLYNLGLDMLYNEKIESGCNKICCVLAFINMELSLKNIDELDNLEKAYIVILYIVNKLALRENGDHIELIKYLYEYNFGNEDINSNRLRQYGEIYSNSVDRYCPYTNCNIVFSKIFCNNYLYSWYGLIQIIWEKYFNRFNIGDNVFVLDKYVESKINDGSFDIVLKNESPSLSSSPLSEYNKNILLIYTRGFCSSYDEYNLPKLSKLSISFFKKTNTLGKYELGEIIKAQGHFEDVLHFVKLSNTFNEEQQIEHYRELRLYVNELVYRTNKQINVIIKEYIDIYLKKNLDEVDEILMFNTPKDIVLKIESKYSNYLDLMRFSQYDLFGDDESIDSTMKPFLNKHKYYLYYYIKLYYNELKMKYKTAKTRHELREIYRNNNLHEIQTTNYEDDGLNYAILNIFIHNMLFIINSELISATMSELGKASTIDLFFNEDVIRNANIVFDSSFIEKNDI